MKKIFVTGANGQLGSALVNLGCIPFEADVTNFDAVRLEMMTKLPDVLIHCVGMGVDASTTEYSKAITLTTRGVANVIDTAIYPNTQFIYISSSHIFDGKKGKYREDAKPNPINDYGLLKFSGESIAKMSGGKIIRLSTCFNEKHKDIVEWRYVFGKDYHEDDNPYIEVPNFIRRSYAHVNHIALGIMEFAKRWEQMPQILNIAGTEDLSMYEFALTVASHYGWDKRLIEPRKKELNISGQAKRPHKASLNVGAAKKLGIPLFSVYEGVKLL